MSLPWADFGTLQEDVKRACSNLCRLKHFTFRISMSFFSFLPSPGSILGNLANCLPSVVGDPETHLDFSVLGYVSALLTSVASDLFPSELSAQMVYSPPWGADLGSLSLLTQFPSLLFEHPHSPLTPKTPYTSIPSPEPS